MTRLRILLAACVLFACPRADLDQLIFPCSIDGDCPSGMRCHPQELLCRSPEQIDEDAGTPDADAGMLDEGMTCIASGASWWCYAATPQELEAFAAANGVQPIDLEVEAGDPLRYAAVLSPPDGLLRSWSYDLGKSAIADQVRAWMRPVDLEPFERDQEQSFAATFEAAAYACPYFWYDTRADSAEELRTALRSVSLPLMTLQRYGSPSRATGLAFGTGTTTIGFALAGGAIAQRLRDGSHSLLSFDAVGVGDLFNYVLGGPARERTAWVYQLTREELERRSTELEAHVARIGISEENGERRFAALLVSNSTIAEARRAESLRLASMLREGAASATVGVYRKLLDGPAEIFSGEQSVFSARNMLGPLIAQHALELAFDDPPRLSLDEAIELPLAGCTSSTASAETITIRDAISSMLRDQEVRSATALVNRFGLWTLDDFARARALRRTMLRTPPGCDAAGDASTTTLLDQALLYETALHCFGRSNPTLRGWLPGRTSDPEALRSLLDELIAEEGARAGFTSSATVAFGREAEIVYTASTLSDPSEGVVRRAVAGRLRIPRCGPSDVEYDVHFFGLFLEGEASEAGAETAIARVKSELLRAPLLRGLAAGARCW